MSAQKIPRYTKTAIHVWLWPNAASYADFCHPAVTVTPKIKFRNNKKYNFLNQTKFGVLYA